MQPIRPITVDQIPSTNEAVKNLAREGAPEGVLMIARLQTHGYGRLARSFFSPPDTGLYMSLLLKPTFSPEKAPLLTHAAAVSLAGAIEAVAGCRTEIKWVNDIYVEGKKAAGILVESALDKNGGLAYAVLGIGVNLLPPAGGFPPMPTAPTAIFPAAYRETLEKHKNDLIREILSRFTALYDAFPDTAFLEEYRRRSLLIGRDVSVYDALTDRERTGGGTPAHVLDVTEAGGLLVRYKDGRCEELSSGEVTLRI